MYPEASPESIFMQKHFGKYYSQNRIDSVLAVPEREFGYGVFRRKIANRNMAFSSAEEMNSFLRERVPLFFSYSNSYYKFPERTPMQSKQWLGSDLIYEFDADELGLEVPMVGDIQWFSKEHLDEAKRQVFRLVEFLQKDFGFSPDGLLVNFSGKAGYHVHFRSKEVYPLGKSARIELVDYLTGRELSFERIGFDFNSNRIIKSQGLWQKRIVSGLKEFFSQPSAAIAKVVEKDLPSEKKKAGSQKRKIDDFLKDREAFFSLLDKGVLPSFAPRKNEEFWQKVLQEVAKNCVVPVDRQTSVDLNKIIRVPQTLHGETGLLAKTVLLGGLDDFDPFVDAVVFGSEEVKVKVIKAPKFSLAGKSFGPFEDEDITLPLFCAVYLIGKGAAVLKA